MISVGLLLAVGLAVLHSFLARIPLPRKWISQAQWLSFAGGVSIAYVFLEVFPELSYSQKTLAAYSKVPALAYIEHHAYLLALIGLVLSYGLNSYATKMKSDRAAGEATMQESQLAFWLHIVSFTLLNGIVGYLLQNLSEHSLTQCLLFFAAMALHFFIIDHHLREHHERLYDRGASWLLTGAIITGAIVGQVMQLSEAAIAVVWSFLAGSIILNVMKRELPDHRQGRFVAFLVGVSLYALLLLLYANGPTAHP